MFEDDGCWTFECAFAGRGEFRKTSAEKGDALLPLTQKTEIDCVDACGPMGTSGVNQ